jgi:hypothetical protein
MQASKQPKTGEPQGRKGTTKSQTFHQLHEACPLKRGKVNPRKTLSLEEPSSVVTSLLSVVLYLQSKEIFSKSHYEMLKLSN